MRKVRRICDIILILGYLIATIVKSDFWGNLLSPVITFEAFFIVLRAFYYKEQRKNIRLLGLLLSLSLLVWAVTDVLWAVCDMILHINPEKVDIITFGYAFTNLFLVISLTIYGISVFRKWNIMQVLLDSVVMTYFVIDLIWIVFLNQNIRNILILRSDWLTTASIISDILIIIWIFIWYMSVRDGKIPLFLRIMAAGILLYSISDLTYFYQYMYSSYEPNSIIDAFYEASFVVMGISALHRLNKTEVTTGTVLFNIGQKGKGYALLLAPLLLFLFKGVDVTNLLKFVLVILIYQILSIYIQNNIQKESMLLKEQEHNHELELKVKERTEELEEKNRVLQHLLDQDFVTGLKNRRYLLVYLENAITNLKAGNTIVLLYIDVNRIKMISTMFGKYNSDMILYEIAEKLKPLEKQAESGVLTSYGDETFVFAASGPYNYGHGHDFAREAVKLAGDFYTIDDYQLRITFNIGISLFPSDSSTVEELLRHADLAMSQARGRGFNLANEFDESLSNAVYHRNKIEIMLKNINMNKELLIYYQPQFKAVNKELIGFEALLRWVTPDGTMIPPIEFIPIAEETGYILPIGEWVMIMALKQLTKWNSTLKKKVMVGINVSIRQLATQHFLERLKEEVEKLQINPEWIDLEITESLKPEEYPEILNMLEDARKAGVKISIDDFGTGYSSLSYLKNLPVDRLKLAKELVDNIHTDEFVYELVKAIISLSKIKGIKVIAEGVETKEQWEVLNELECDEVQGYYFGRPQPAEVIEETFFEEPA